MKTISRRQLANYAIEEMIKGSPASQVAKQVSAELIDRGRQDQSELLIKDIYQTLESRGLTATAEVTSARALSGPSKKLIEDFVKQLTKTQYVKLSEQTDPSLLAGFKVETATLSWDASAKNRLNKFAKKERK